MTAGIKKGDLCSVHCSAMAVRYLFGGFVTVKVVRKARPGTGTVSGPPRHIEPGPAEKEAERLANPWRDQNRGN